MTHDFQILWKWMTAVILLVSSIFPTSSSVPILDILDEGPISEPQTKFLKPNSSPTKTRIYNYPAIILGNNQQYR